MSTYRQVFYQLVFSTKHREPVLVAEYVDSLYRYIWGIIRARGCHLYRIGGVEDHIHIFSDLHPSVCLADFVKEIKVGSNSWMKASGLFPEFRGWQDGYGAFTYHLNQKDILIAYIKNQRAHHQRETFEEEYRRLLEENGVAFDENHLLQTPDPEGVSPE